MAHDDDAARIARSLTEQQRSYVEAVAASSTPYTPQQGRVSNWALRHGLVEPVAVMADGRSIVLSALTPPLAPIERIVGQVLTPLGRAIHQQLMRSGEAWPQSQVQLR